MQIISMPLPTGSGAAQATALSNSSSVSWRIRSLTYALYSTSSPRSSFL